MSQLMEWRQVVQTSVCFHILLHSGLGEVLVALSSMSPWPHLRLMQHRAEAMGSLSFNARRRATSAEIKA